jgi:hypothetical protein
MLSSGIVTEYPMWGSGLRWGSGQRWGCRETWRQLRSNLSSLVGGGVPVQFRLQLVWGLSTVQCAKWGIRPFGLDEALLCVSLLQPLPCCAPASQNPISVRFDPHHEDVWFNTEYSVLRHANTHFWRFSPYSTPGTCGTIPAVHYLLTLPCKQPYSKPTKIELVLAKMRLGSSLNHIHFGSLLYCD